MAIINTPIKRAKTADITPFILLFYCDSKYIMKPIIIQSPVRGRWAFMNPPGHHPDAKDFVAVNIKGMPYHPFNLIVHIFYRLKVENTFAWGKEVFSPFDGKVIKVSNKQNDRYNLNLLRDLIKGLVFAPGYKNRGIDYFLGNYIIIESAEGIFTLLAHLKKGSISVEEGQHVKSGDSIARVGNSGNTIQPHLHFQLMRENEPENSIPIPFSLESYRLNNQRTITGLPDNYKSFNV